MDCNREYVRSSHLPVVLFERKLPIKDYLILMSEEGEKRKREYQIIRKEIL
jgi:hypothetical protein